MAPLLLMHARTADACQPPCPLALHRRSPTCSFAAVQRHCTIHVFSSACLRTEDRPIRFRWVHWSAEQPVLLQVCMLHLQSPDDKLLCFTAAGDAGLGGAAAHNRLQQALQASALPDMGLPEGDDLLGTRITPHCTPCSVQRMHIWPRIEHMQHGHPVGFTSLNCCCGPGMTAHMPEAAARSPLPLGQAPAGDVRRSASAGPRPVSAPTCEPARHSWHGLHVPRTPAILLTAGTASSS